jgi:hypothetical protein
MGLLSDPGILFNIYGSYTSYTVPGPNVYVPGSSTGGGSGTTATTRAITSATPTSTSAAPTPTGPAAVKYAQCGGTGWTGATQCVTGSTCTKVNDVSELVICVENSRLTIVLSTTTNVSEHSLGLLYTLLQTSHCATNYMCTNMYLCVYEHSLHIHTRKRGGVEN